MLYELIYHSTTAHDFDKSQIKAILETSHLNNEKKDITGCLIFHKNEFVQILEGDEHTVKDLNAKIMKDPRHNNSNVIASGKTDSRAFDKWTMAFHDFSSIEINEHNRISIELLLAMIENIKNPTVAKSLFKLIAEDMFSK